MAIHFGLRLPIPLVSGAAVTLSRADVQKVSEILVRALEESANLIKSSKEEEIYCLAADFFRVHGT